LKKMNLPRPKWYTADELAEYLEVNVSIVHRYTQTSQLQKEIMYSVEGQDRWEVSWLPEDSEKHDVDVHLLEGWYPVGAYYKLEEVERFEEEHRADVSETQEKQLENQEPETTREKQHLTHQGQILVGWKKIAEYLKVSESTAKRYSKGSRWLRHGPTTPFHHWIKIYLTTRSRLPGAAW